MVMGPYGFQFFKLEDVRVIWALESLKNIENSIFGELEEQF